ncbi:hypothetical protein CkaCkLH20_12602 [Colletotrichum karsti]|uniref:Uncharacterized protein n=1 Tax=Colletotrichum karsti TaxID=1095194 RepID=A0A9P6LEU8_9PEZI|nr:uncharacterized protein CkaCkLH20_12602 [Colletotrichum karsti]KAF9869895.1 hypothetical protein CkaCkLH20_12602 [Colletotrichum karsti]
MTEAMQEFYSGHNRPTQQSRIVCCNAPFRKEAQSHHTAKAVFAAAYKVELGDAIPADQDVKVSSQGD